MSVADGVLAQLAAQAPTLLVLLAGCAVAVAWRRRCPQVCVLLFCGCALCAVASVGGAVATQHLIERSRAAATPSASLLVGLVGVIAGALRAGGIALLIAAAVSGRGPRA